MTAFTRLAVGVAVTIFACYSVEGQTLTSSDLTGRRYVCDNEALQLECRANNVARMAWTYTQGQQIYFGSDEKINTQKHKGSATAILTRNVQSRHRNRSNLTSRLTIRADSSISNGSVECRTGRGQSSMQILVSETPHPPDVVSISAIKDGIVVSIHDNIQDNRWELRHYLITVYDEARNVLSRHKLIDTPILLIEHVGIDSIEVVTITLCQQESSANIFYVRNIVTVLPCPTGGAQRNLITCFVYIALISLALAGFLNFGKRSILIDCQVIHFLSVTKAFDT